MGRPRSIDPMKIYDVDESPVGGIAGREQKNEQRRYKGIMKAINELCPGKAADGEFLIRDRVFVDYIDMRERKKEGFDCEAQVIVGLMKELRADLRAGHFFK